ncbi:chromatin-remodeling complex ATPase chain isw-1-like [Ochlerotatus camptorhynchus]|uniref:chromatin-remodeling complex ATPase chain isw-1-like n=1 Tax=Ochlerotatus camptorhynchus TaxID=644619 RepID=UPI0031DB02D7
MTGTPINNNLHELWALLNLLLPDFFRNSEDFDEWFKVEDCIDPDHERAVRLKKILQPIMLHRIKSDVEYTIPPKIKTTMYIPPTREMNYWSKKVLCKDIKVPKGDGTAGNFIMRIVFPYLREVTLHPYLIPGAESTLSDLVGQDIVDVSSRMVVLDKLLTKLSKRGARVLLFSQMVIMLDILQDYLEWKGYKFHRMTGNTEQRFRQEMIDEFNSPDSDTFIFLTTTRTGGVGINLHTADTVIFYDIDWNPQADFQAEDRAHRIRQLKQVHVIRFTVSGTVDEYLHDCSNRKQVLDKAIIRKSLGDCVEFQAIEHHKRKLESVNCLDVAAVDEQLNEMFKEIDRGERNAKNDTLLKQIRFRSKNSRSRSEERELESIKPPVESVPEFDLDSTTYRLRPRKPKIARLE